MERSNGQCDLSTMSADRVWEPLCSSVLDVHAVWSIARTNMLQKGCVVWYRHESEAESAMTPYWSHVNDSQRS
jgi:hypothetical protein